MLQRSLRQIALLASVTLLVSMTATQAQTIVNIRSKNCLASVETDSNGIHLNTSTGAMELFIEQPIIWACDSGQNPSQISEKVSSHTQAQGAVDQDEDSGSAQSVTAAPVEPEEVSGAVSDKGLSAEGRLLIDELRRNLDEKRSLIEGNGVIQRVSPTDNLPIATMDQKDASTMKRLIDLGDRNSQLIARINALKDVSANTRQEINTLLVNNAKLDQQVWSSKSALDAAGSTRRAIEGQREKVAAELAAVITTTSVLLGGALLGMLGIFLLRRAEARRNRAKVEAGLSEHARWNLVEMDESKLILALINQARLPVFGAIVISVALLMFQAIRTFSGTAELLQGAPIVTLFGVVGALLVGMNSWQGSLADRIEKHIRLDKDLRGAV